MPRVGKTHRCHLCCRDFARLEHLQRHQRSHTKEKPFRCPGCPKAFTRRDLLTRHDRLAHQPPNQSPNGGEPQQPQQQQQQQQQQIQQTREQIQQTREQEQQRAQLEPQVQQEFPPYPAHHMPDSEQPQALSSTAPASVQMPIAMPSTAPATATMSSEGLVSTLTPGDSAPSEPATAQAATYHHSQADFAIESFELPLDAFPDDFSSFMDSVPLPHHTFSPTYQPLPPFLPDLDIDLHNLPAAFASAPQVPDLDTGSRYNESSLRGSVTDGLPLSTYGSRLPSLEPETSLRPRPSRIPDRRHREHLVVTARARDRISMILSELPHCVPKGFVLPSKHTLSRFVRAYFDVFHEHYPFLHVPTLQLETVRAELLLAVAALGARYSREPEVGIGLFQLAKAVALESVHRGHAVGEVGDMTAGISRFGLVETMQSLLLLMAIATWYRRQPAVSEALSIRSILDALLRQDTLEHPREQQPAQWHDWVRYEALKRIKLVSFCFFNIHTIVFEVPPMMLASDIHHDLPSSEHEWKATGDAEWRRASAFFDPPQDFQVALEQLFSSGEGQPRPPVGSGFSSLGGYVLVHAILQRIWMTRNASVGYFKDRQLPLDTLNMFERALKSWSMSWECDRESSMDPLSPHGPLSFTSTALLRLAYIRINMDLGPVRSLITWNPELIAESLKNSPPAQRSYKLTRAALHCAHALSIPVKLGISFVAQTQVVYWSNQHAVCSLECAVLLAKWIEAVSGPELNPSLSLTEERTLSFVTSLVAEARYNGNTNDLLLSLQRRRAPLASEVVRLWALLYKFESVWGLVDLIHGSLNAFADLLEA